MLRILAIPRWTTTSLFSMALLCALVAFSITRKISRSSADLFNGRTLVAANTQTSTPADNDDITKRWNSAWQRASSLPACPSRNRALETMLEQLARTDPQRALTLATAEPNWLLRDQLRDAALRGWGAVAPDAAADWAMSKQQLGERMFCINAVLSGAVEHPDEAVRVALRVCATDPSPAGDYGHAVINALIDKAGSYEAATRFALSATMVDRQSYLLDSAFYQWAQHQPELAVAELLKIADPKLRSSVMKGVIEGWADADAQKLAEFAQAMPSGEDRTRFMGVALTQWVAKNPENALEWINKFEPHPDFDRGFSTIALGDTLLKSSPATSMELTEYITDSAQRTLTRDNVFWRWALRDPEGAKKYAESVQNPEYRESMLDDLARLPKDR